MKEQPSRPYRRDELIQSIESINNSIPVFGRTADEYFKMLNVNPENLKGKTILDLGAGRELNFARDLENKGIHAEVVSLSPAFLEGKTWYARRRETEDQPGRLAVAGMAEELPFTDNSFHHILMFYVTPYIDSDERMVKSLQEIIRVLKPGGICYVGPLIPSKTLEVLDVLGVPNSSSRWLDKEKVQAVIEGRAIAKWEDTPNLQGGIKTVTLRIVKDEGQNSFKV